MPLLRSWLIPRIAFWTVWTAWLWLLQSFLLPSFLSHGWPAPNDLATLLVVGPPLLATWIGSRFVSSPLESSWALFWKGAAVSCLLGVFTNIYLIPDLGLAPMLLLPAFALCGFLAVRSGGVKSTEVKHGELFERVQAIARLLRVRVTRLLVFTSARNLPTAFANRMGAILLSERLLAILSRRETDAVIAHEAAHLRTRQRIIVAVLPAMIGVTFFVIVLWPEAKVSAPFWPFAGLLTWRAFRRLQEYDADLASVRATQDPDALITALTRVSSACGMPLSWGKFAGVFMPHPSMTARFRAISLRAGISDARVGELVSAASGQAPLPGYESPLGHRDDLGLLAPYLARLQRRMHLLNAVIPILAGASFPLIDPAASLPGVASWTLAAILLYCLAYEMVAGLERRKLRNQLPHGRDAGASFVGLSTAAEPRIFQNSYHHDLGTTSLGGRLTFNGARCSFSLNKSQVRRIWLAPGPPHWAPRKMVCVEYQLDSISSSAVISMQPLERWFWPRTEQAASQLLAAVREWAARPSQEIQATPDSAPPREAGASVPRIPLSAAWKPVARSCVISMAASSIISPLLLLDGLGLSAFLSAAVTAAVNLFILAPHLRWGRIQAAAPARASFCLVLGFFCFLRVYSRLNGL